MLMLFSTEPGKKACPGLRDSRLHLNGGSREKSHFAGQNHYFHNRTKCSDPAILEIGFLALNKFRMLFSNLFFVQILKISENLKMLHLVKNPEF